MNWIPFLSFVLASIYSPGPNNIASMSNAIRYGFWGSLKFRCGIFCGFFTMQATAALGSAALYDAILTIRPGVQAVGAAYILWLAWKTYSAPPVGESASAARGCTFLSGLTLALLNVKAMLFAITVMSVYALPVSAKPLFLLGFGLMMTLFSFSSINVWAACGAAFSRVLNRHGKAVKTVMALLLVYCAVSLCL